MKSSILALELTQVFRKRPEYSLGLGCRSVRIIVDTIFHIMRRKKRALMRCDMLGKGVRHADIIGHA